MGDRLAEPTPAEREAALVAAAITGDEGAFAGLYDLHVDRVYRHVVYRVGHSQDAEDLTQQVFVQAWRALPRYRQTQTPFIAWLLTIAHNAVVSFYRRAKPSISIEEAALDWPSDGRIESTTEINVEHERVRRAILGLKRDQQQVLTMRFLEDVSYRDIAAAMGRTEANVRLIQHRALAELRRRMALEED
jgi:RNA polymerase sigma-70 factor (ECF subfamily)